MKILIIMAGFFPGKKYGGPPVSADNFCSLLNDEECYIVTSNHDMNETIPYKNIESNIWIDRGNCKIKYLSDIDYRAENFEKAIVEIRPDVLYLQGLFQACILPCLKLAKKHNIKVLLAPRGELCAGAFKKKYKKLPYITFLKVNGLLKNVSFQSTSEEETSAIRHYLAADSKKIYFLTNIPSIPKKIFSYVPKNPGEGRFVFLARIHSKKNLLSAIRYFMNVSGNATFDIYGPIEDEVYWEECQEAIKQLPSNIQVNYCGLTSHDEVHAVFSKYDAFVFPTFSENYGHVIAESLIVGTPAIISDQTPWRELEKNSAGWDIALTNESGFIDAIQNIIDNDNSMQLSIREKTLLYARRQFDLNRLKNEYLKALHGK